MDRRIKKSRNAIYQSFISLLNQKNYEAITVQNIIEHADVGRSTFYAHFETKEALLEYLCQDLFQHIFDDFLAHTSLENALAHLFFHFKYNQDKITTLLLANNPYFTRRLKIELKTYLFPLIREQLMKQNPNLPELFLENYVSTTFIETISWWLQQRTEIDEVRITHYFLSLMNYSTSS